MGCCRKVAEKTGVSSIRQAVARKHVAIALVKGRIGLRARKPCEERRARAVECHRPRRPLLGRGERALGARRVPPHPRAALPCQPGPPLYVVPVQLLASHRAVRRARVTRERLARRAYRGVGSEIVRNGCEHL